MMAVAALFGSGLGAANGNALTELGPGALAGVFPGWFIAAAALEKDKAK